MLCEGLELRYLMAIDLVSTVVPGLEAITGNSESHAPDFNDDGKFVTFVSFASNLVDGDTNDAADIFVKNLTTGTTTRVSTDSNGTQAISHSYEPRISGDGKFVTFMSFASNLVNGDTNGTYDIFVKDLTTGTTTRVNTHSNGTQTDRESFDPSISGDGKFVTFTSNASNLVEDDSNGLRDIFVKDLTTGTTTRVSTNSAGTQANSTSVQASISGDGKFVTFTSNASNLVSGDSNGLQDIFVKDLTTGTTTRVSTDSNGTQADSHSYEPSISSDGKFVTFVSDASNLVSGDFNGFRDIFVKDLTTGTTTRVSMDSNGTQANNYSDQPSISGDGKFITFMSGASNLVDGDTNNTTDIFVKDLTTGATTRVNTGSNGIQANGDSQDPSISGDGKFVTFTSDASNLHTADQTIISDIFRVSLNLYTLPPTDISLSSSSVAENLPATTSVGILNTTDPNSGNTFTYSLVAGPGDTDNGNFQIDVSTLKTNATFDFETKADYSVRVRTTDSDGLWTEKFFSIQVTNVNELPFGIALSMDSIAENSISGMVVGLLSTSDPDMADTFTYSLVSGVGSSDNASFAIDVNANLRSAAAFDFESKNLYSVRIRSTDAGGLWTERAVNVQVVDVDEIPPTVTSASVLPTGIMATSQSTITVTFSEPVLNATNVSNYELRRAGDDGLLVNSDAVIYPVNVTLKDKVATLTLATSLVEDIYRLTVKDAITDVLGNALDGDANGVAMGDRKLDFVSIVGAGNSIKLVSNDNSGLLGNADSLYPNISSNGRNVVFQSFASNLISGDTNGQSDVFAKDMQSGSIMRVSTDTVGTQGNNNSYDPVISADNRYVAFHSDATNLVTGDTNNTSDIFVKDLQTGFLTRISTTSTGLQAFGFSRYPSVSSNGRFVAFESSATNLVTGDTNFADDAFVKDTQTGALSRVSLSSAGVQGNGRSLFPKLNADGRFVVFESLATNLVSGDTNGLQDVFVKDRQTGSLIRVSTNSFGAQGNGESWDPSLSADGRFVTFFSHASNLVSGDTNNAADVFLKNLQTGVVTRVSSDSSGIEGNGPSFLPAMSADGRYVAFRSEASNLVPGDTNNSSDMFIKDIQTGAIVRVSTDISGVQGNAHSYFPSVSSDGRFITFYSWASNLVSGDTNNVRDIFFAENRLMTGTGTAIVTLLSPSGYSFDFVQKGSNVGQSLQGYSNAFDGLNRLRVNGVNFQTTTESTMDDGGRTIVTANSLLSNFVVRRELTIPSAGTQDFVRTIDVFTNSTGSSTTVPVRILGNLGSDASTIVFATSDGDTIVEPTDTWLGTDDADPNGGTPAIIHLIHGPGGLIPSQVSVIEDNVDWTYNLTVPAGQTKRLATFTILGNTRQQAIDAVNALINNDGFGGQAAAFLGQDESASIANFQFGTLSANLDGSGNLVVMDTDTTGKNNTLSLSRSGNNIVISDVDQSFTSAPTGGTLSNGNKSLTIPVGLVTSLAIHGSGGNDHLTIDFSGGNPITANGISFLGGENAGDVDELTLAGYNLMLGDGIADLIVSHTGAESGSVTLSGLGAIYFDQIEPLTFSGT
ncbi:MAG TPA: hypothetical protein VM260_09970, partial [Pirellula sp.]|nr:hypothetical protein [Pirellula sp.]